MIFQMQLNDERLEALNRHLDIQARLVARGCLVPNIADEHVAYTVGAARAAGWKPEAERQRRKRA